MNISNLRTHFLTMFFLLDGSVTLISLITVVQSHAAGTSIVGAGAATTIIQQTTSDRVFETNPVPQATGFTFNISGVTIKDGNTTGSGGGILGGGPGSVTTITDCIFDNDRVTGTLASNGGAISFTSANTGNLTITNTSFTNNKTATGVGGAIRF